MNIHEYQAKNLLRKFGVFIPPYFIASSEEEISDAIQELGLDQGGVAKVQIHAGGRGKAGGVKVAKNREELQREATGLLGKKIVNHQTGPTGVVCEKVLITPALSLEKEYYLAAIIDRHEGRPLLLASPAGGMEIEEIAQKEPDKLLKIPIQNDGTIRSYHLIELAHFMGWTGAVAKEGKELAAAVARAFVESDGSLLEINPLALTADGSLAVIDAKFTIDDNALYRHPDIVQWYDPTQLTKGEQLANEMHLAYIGLDGDIGCLVNGAGLAMATMDIISHYGGRPANFLDVGGGASREQVSHAFKIILSDPNVKKIFVNIFGGIMDCGVIAEGIVTALGGTELKIPLIVRLEGTNVEKGKEILKQSGLVIQLVNTMEEGAMACQS